MYILLDACQHPGILRIIYFGSLLLDIVFTLVPIGLIVILMIDFSKAVIGGDEKAVKSTKIVGKRIIYAMIVFCIPWIVEVFMSLMDSVGFSVNYQECLSNAKSGDFSYFDSLLEKVDTIIIGGGMAYTFLKAQGYKIGTSLCEDDRLDYAKEMIEKAAAKGVKFLLPVDHRVAAEFKDVEATVTEGQDIPDGFMGLDIGPKTEALYAEAIKDAKTVVWNGPMGVFEFENYNKGTIAVAKAMADADATTVIGGGDSAAAVNQLGYGDKMTHISTGGGASLEFLEGKTLPGIAALNDK